MKKYIMILLLSIGFSQQGEVTNVIADQRTDGSHLLDVYYDLSPDETFLTFSVHGEISFDNGETWNWMVVDIHPNVLGDNILPGEGKHFVYDLGEHANQFDEFEGFSDQTQIKIVAYGHESTELPFEMMHVSAGEYTFGPDDETRSIDYAYEMMKYEVTNAQYLQFLQPMLEEGSIYIEGTTISGYYSGNEWFPPGNYKFLAIDLGQNAARPIYAIIEGDTINLFIREGFGLHPVGEASLLGALAFAEHYGLRIPSHEEWVKAARGNTGNDYPWGDEIDGTMANYNGSYDPWEDSYYGQGNGTTPVGYYDGTAYDYPDGFYNYLGCVGLGYTNCEDLWYAGLTSFITTDSPSSPFGIYDLAGNVAEWTTTYHSDAWFGEPAMILAGGMMNAGASSVKTTSFTGMSSYAESSGIRCIRTVNPE